MDKKLTLEQHHARVLDLAALPEPNLEAHQARVLDLAALPEPDPRALDESKKHRKLNQPWAPPPLLDWGAHQRAYERQRLELAEKEELARLRVREQWEAGRAAAKAQPAPKPSKEDRQDRRLQVCIDSGLPMNERALRRMPDGIGAVAEGEGVTRQTFTEDVRAALHRMVEKSRPKPRLVTPKR